MLAVLVRPDFLTGGGVGAGQGAGSGGALAGRAVDDGRAGVGGDMSRRGASALSSGTSFSI